MAQRRSHNKQERRAESWESGGRQSGSEDLVWPGWHLEQGSGRAPDTPRGPQAHRAPREPEPRGSVRRAEQHPEARASTDDAPSYAWPPPNPAGPWREDPDQQALSRLGPNEHERAWDWGPPEAPRGPRVPPEILGAHGHSQPRRLLGILKEINDPYFRHFELIYLRFIRKLLVRQWHLMQAERDERALKCWRQALWLLEVDTKGQVDLFLLAQCGLAGRAEANEILWNLLSECALDQSYRDLSYPVSHQAHEARQAMERPPKEHKDRGHWQ